MLIPCLQRPTCKLAHKYRDAATEIVVAMNVPVTPVKGDGDEPDDCFSRLSVLAASSPSAASSKVGSLCNSLLSFAERT